MFTLLFFAACAVYLLTNLWLVRGLRIVRARRAEVGRSSGVAADQPMITVLVAARDEELNLPRTLAALLAQDWPAGKTQIVVVNDRSGDGTARVLADHVARYPGRIDTVHVTHLPPGLSPKKHALSRGLEIARGSWIAVTDADCIMGPRWLSSLAAEFGTAAVKGTGEGEAGSRRPPGMVIGTTAYEEPARGLTPSEGARALEFMSYGVSTAGLIGLGFPVLANANNLAYRRAAFDEAGAYARHGDVVSGDDDFILQEIHATGHWDIRYCTTADARVFTTPPQTWRHFWEQRRRWAGKCIHYRPPQLAFLAFIFTFYAALAGLLLAGLLGFCGGGPALLGLAGLGVKAVAEFLLMREGLSLLGQRSLLRYFPLTAVLHIPLVLGATVAGTLGRSTWKGQRMGTKA